MTSLIGVWRLVSWKSEFQATGERVYPFGKKATGYLIFTPEGRLVGILAGEGHKKPTTDQDYGNQFVAYTGLYRVEGDKWTTRVDVSSNPAWVGTENVRIFRLEGDRLHIETGWMEAVAQPEKGMSREYLIWERVK